jgi:hypothetical protein
MIVWVLVALLSETSGQPSTVGMSTSPSGPFRTRNSVRPVSASASVRMPAAQFRSGCMSRNSCLAPPLASTPVR